MSLYRNKTGRKGNNKSKLISFLKKKRKYIKSKMKSQETNFTWKWKCSNLNIELSWSDLRDVWHLVFLDFICFFSAVIAAGTLHFFKPVLLLLKDKY